MAPSAPEVGKWAPFWQWLARILEVFQIRSTQCAGGVPKSVTMHPIVPCGADSQRPQAGSSSVGPGHVARLLRREFRRCIS